MRLSPIMLLYGAAAALTGYVAYQIYYYGAAEGTAALNTINPVNPDNIFAKGANKVLQSITGDSAATIGATWWRWMNPSAAAVEDHITAPTLAPAPGATPATGSLDPAVPGRAAGGAPAVTLPQDVDPAVSIIFGGGA